MQDLNKTRLVGTVLSIEPYYSNDFGRFNKLWLCVPRLSEKVDILPVVASEKLLVESCITAGDNVIVSGDMRSANVEAKKALSIFSYAYAIEKISSGPAFKNNEVEMIGHLCESPRIHQAPDGRISSEFIVANNRGFGKSSYVPVIAWHEYAISSQAIKKGTTLKLRGRFQSRKYHKLQNGIPKEGTAYELSLSSFHPVQ